jgi:hypothetical protein
MAELVREHATAGRTGQSADQSGRNRRRVWKICSIGHRNSDLHPKDRTIGRSRREREWRGGGQGHAHGHSPLMVFGPGVSVGVAADLMLERNNRASGDVPVRQGTLTATQRVVCHSDRVVRTALRPTAVGARLQVRLQDRLQHQASLWSASPGPQFETAGATPHCVRDTRNAAQVEPLSSVETVAEFPRSAASA